MEKEKLGKFISELRKEKQLTQQELADKLNISVTAVSKWERGLNFPDITMFPLLANALEISVFELFTQEKTDNI